MTDIEFENILEARIRAIRSVLSSKAREYALGGRLHNFNRAAEILRSTPERALLGMLVKHLVSVIDLVNGALPLSKRYVDEKIGDSINYLILLEAVFVEKLKKSDFDVCQ